MKSALKLALITLLLSFTTQAHAIIYDPIVDGTVFDFNDDGVGDFVNSTGFPQALWDSGFQSRAFFEYDLQPLAGNYGQAFLDLTVDAANGPFPLNLDVFGYTGDGLITESDYDLGIFDQTYVYTGEDKYTLDISDLFLTNSSNDYLGINIRMQTETNIGTGAPYVAHNSLENLPAAKLRLVERKGDGNPTVPEPATMALFGTGLLGAFIRRKLTT